MKQTNKKVGFVTFHRANNLGAALQASALCKFINENISPCEIIDFVPNNSCGSNYMQKLPLLRNLKNAILSLKDELSRNKAAKFASFRREEMCISKRTYYGDNEMLKASNKYNVLISGSDQILNSTLSGNSKSYYLAFDEQAKKISYASSFGRDNISENEISLIKSELSKFDDLSVREASASSLIKSYIGKESTLVVDPVFLLNRKDWEIVQSNELKTPNKYIFVYSMEVSKTLENIVKNMHDETNLPVIVVRGGGKSGLIIGTEDCNCGPKEFLRYISNAEYIITNSFHGTAMSLIFGKKFISVSHSSRNARLSNIFDMINSSDKLVPFEGTSKNVDEYIIDGANSYTLLKKTIDFSKDFLTKSINK